MVATSPTGEHRQGGEPRWLNDEEEAAWRGLLLVHAHVTALLTRQLAPTGLSLHDYGVLVLLSDSSDGSCRPFELGSTLGIEKTRLSHQLRRLEERGLVSRRRCPTDQRGWLIAITDAGRQMLESAAPGHVEAVRDVFVDRLDEHQLRTMAEVAAAVLSGRDAEAACDEDDGSCP